MQLTLCYMADADEVLRSSLPAESLLKLEPNFRGRASANDIQQCDYYGRLDFATSVWKSRTMDGTATPTAHADSLRANGSWPASRRTAYRCRDPHFILEGHLLSSSAE